MEQHEKNVQAIQECLKKEKDVIFSLSQEHKVSNTVRSKPYCTNKLPLSCLNRIVKVDVEKQVAFVEPRVTMDRLVKETLKYGLVPAVVPEFKSITVGGAINGAALESSSHKYGQFNDCCLSYELILGDGTLIRASKESHPDLFYGVSGSYGSLAVIVGVEVALIPAKRFVALHYTHFSSVKEAVAFMTAEHKKSAAPEFIEAIVYHARSVVVITAEPTDKKTTPVTSLKHCWSKWYYQHVEQKVEKQQFQDTIPFYDYLFRSDLAAFWMGGYALHAPLLFRYILESLRCCPKWLDKWLMPANRSKYCKMKRAGPLFRALFGWMMPSKRLYHFLHRDTEAWFANHFVIQDYYMPGDETVLFTHEVLARFGITPLWLCPMKPTNTPQLFSPHAIAGHKLLFDVGVYGMAEKAVAGNFVTAELDDLAKIKGGRKMLYSYSYYSEQQFWEIYDREAYHTLRGKTEAEGRFHPITTKVLG